MRAITAAIKVGRLSRDSGRYLVGPVQLREQLEMGNITSRPQEFAGGFVDFLLGRGARHTPSSMIPASPSRRDALNDARRRADRAPYPRGQPLSASG
jgi:hypothetical protein